MERWAPLHAGDKFFINGVIAVVDLSQVVHPLYMEEEFEVHRNMISGITVRAFKAVHQEIILTDVWVFTHHDQTGRLTVSTEVGHQTFNFLKN